MVLSAKMNPLHRNRHLFKHILLLAFPFLISTHLNLYEKIMIRSQPLYFLYTPLQYRNIRITSHTYCWYYLQDYKSIFFLINFGIRHNFSSFNLKRGQKYGLSVNIYIRIQTLTTSVTYDYYWLRLTLQTVQMNLFFIQLIDMKGQCQINQIKLKVPVPGILSLLH